MEHQFASHSFEGQRELSYYWWWAQNISFIEKSGNQNRNKPDAREGNLSRFHALSRKIWKIYKNGVEKKIL